MFLEHTKTQQCCEFASWTSWKRSSEKDLIAHTLAELQWTGFPCVFGGNVPGSCMHVRKQAQVWRERSAPCRWARQGTGLQLGSVWSRDRVCLVIWKVFQNMAVLQSGENRFVIEIQLMRFIKLPLCSRSVSTSGFWYFFPVCKPEFDFLVLHFKKRKKKKKKDFESV